MEDRDSESLPSFIYKLLHTNNMTAETDQLKYFRRLRTNAKGNEHYNKFNFQSIKTNK